jgi:hypothetical protein
MVPQQRYVYLLRTSRVSERPTRAVSNLTGKKLRNVKEQHKSCSHSVPPSNVGSFMCEPRPNARQQKIQGSFMCEPRPNARQQKIQGSFMCEPRPNARQQKSSNRIPTLKEKLLITTRVGDSTGTYRQTFPNSECGHETLSS